MKLSPRHQLQPQHRAKASRMKLFEQPIGKLFSPKHIKQLSALLQQEASSQAAEGAAADDAQRPKSAAPTRLKRSSLVSYSVASTLRSLASRRDSAAERRRLLLQVLPAPVKNLLVELYLRGPATVGIFRKSPNARHCKELRLQLEADSQADVRDFQVNVIASVFKEWLRSLPDSLLMSRLYPQWIDVAKLIEPLHQHNQIRQHHYEQHLLLMSTLCYQTGSLELSQKTKPPNAAPFGDNLNEESSSSLTLNPLTDSRHGNEQNISNNDQLHQPLDRRTQSWSTASPLVNAGSDARDLAGKLYQLSSSHLSNKQQTAGETWSDFALHERHSECLRIVRQLLDALDEANLILLRSFICVLWHIAQNSEENKMSANNLGVCVGQSLLNDGCQSVISLGNKSESSSSLIKRHKRTRSQCLLSSTLSLTMSPTPTSGLQSARSMAALQDAGLLDTSGMQETAKYVPMLMAFMIENAQAIFGDDIDSMFDVEETLQRRAELKLQQSAETSWLTSGDDSMLTNSVLSDDIKENGPRDSSPSDPVNFDQTDHGICSSSSLMSSDSESPNPAKGQQSERKVVVVDGIFPTPDQTSATPATNQTCDKRNDTTTTSILIVNSPQTTQSNQCIVASLSQSPSLNPSPSLPLAMTNSGHHQRELNLSLNHLQDPEGRDGTQCHHISSTESTGSSSRASSSTSGVHSHPESPAFSAASEPEEQALPTRGGLRSLAKLANEHENHETNSPLALSTLPSPSPTAAQSTPPAIQPNDAPKGSDEINRSINDVQALNRSPTNVNNSPKNLVGRPKSMFISSNSFDSAIVTSSQSAARGRRFDNQMNLSNYSMNQQHSALVYSGTLNRVPKIPVQYTTSSYGGEAIIYNPKPRQQQQMLNQTKLVASDNSQINNSVISIEKHQLQQQKAQLASTVNVLDQGNQSNNIGNSLQNLVHIGAEDQKELKDLRLNEFLARQQQQQTISCQQQPSMMRHPSLVVSASSLPFYGIVQAQQQRQAVNRACISRHQSIVADHQQQVSNIGSYVSLQHQPQSQQHLKSMFYPTSNLNSCQPNNQYSTYQNHSLQPQRSHVMLLRDYYLSLQRDQMLQQQQVYAYRDRIEQRQRLSASFAHDFKQHQYRIITNPAAPQQAMSGHQQQNGFTTHQPIQKPAPRLAKIRQNQLNTIQASPIQVVPSVKGVNPISPLNRSTIMKQQNSSLTVKSQSSSDNNDSSDDSDDLSNEWLESTMV